MSEALSDLFIGSKENFYYKPFKTENLLSRTNKLFLALLPNVFTTQYSQIINTSFPYIIVETVRNAITLTDNPITGLIRTNNKKYCSNGIHKCFSCNGKSFQWEC